MQKRAFLRKQDENLARGFFLDRARLLAIPVGLPAVVQRLRKIRLDRQRAVEANQGFVDTAQSQKRIATVVPRFSIVRRNGERAVETRQSLFDTAQPKKGMTTVEQRSRIIGLNGECAVVTRHGLIQAL